MKLGNTSSAVMEQHAPQVVRGDDPVTALFRKLNFFPTPPWAARAIAHRIKEYDQGALVVADPGCGEGHMAEPAREVFGAANVLTSDIYDYGYGDVCDFLTQPPLYAKRPVDWFIMNPPFDKAGEFIEQGLRLAQRGVISLCRMAFLESGGREKLLYESAAPMTCIMPFVERVPMQLGCWDPNGSTASAYGAFAFFKGHAPRAHWPFPSGTQRRYARFDDAARFAKPAPIPLFEKLAPARLFNPGENQ